MRLLKQLPLFVVLLSCNVALADDPVATPTPGVSTISTECQAFDVKLAKKAAQTLGEQKIKQSCTVCTDLKISVKITLDKNAVSQNLPLDSVISSSSMEFVALPAASSPTPAAASGTPVATPTATPTPDPNSFKVLKFVDPTVLALPNSQCSVSADSKITARFKINGKRIKQIWAGKIKLSGIAKLAKGVR